MCTGLDVHFAKGSGTNSTHFARVIVIHKAREAVMVRLLTRTGEASNITQLSLLLTPSTVNDGLIDYLDHYDTQLAAEKLPIKYATVVREQSKPLHSDI